MDFKAMYLASSIDFFSIHIGLKHLLSVKLADYWQKILIRRSIGFCQLSAKIYRPIQKLADSLKNMIGLTLIYLIIFLTSRLLACWSSSAYFVCRCLVELFGLATTCGKLMRVITMALTRISIF